MTNRRKRRLAAAGLVGATVVAAGTAAAGDVTVTVSGVRSAKGSVAGALFDSAEGWLEKDRRVAGARAAAAPGAVELVFEGVPPGSYAFAAYHDENDNGEFDTLLGLPKEGLAFSNGQRASVLGPPAFEDARVTVGDGAPAALVVEMRY